MEIASRVVGTDVNLCDYERRRAANVARNNAELMRLGFNVSRLSPSSTTGSCSSADSSPTSTFMPSPAIACTEDVSATRTRRKSSRLHLSTRDSRISPPHTRRRIQSDEDTSDDELVVSRTKLLGVEVKKRFGSVLFRGRVTRVSNTLVHIVYDDGDEEDFDDVELKKYQA